MTPHVMYKHRMFIDVTFFPNTVKKLSDGRLEAKGYWYNAANPYRGLMLCSDKQDTITIREVDLKDWKEYK